MRTGIKRRGINRRLPWLKFGVVAVGIFFIIFGVRGVFRYYSGEGEVKVPKTPMAIQPEVPERVFRGSLEGKSLVALTFDDGPSPSTTPRLLDILKEKGVVATFFELGGMVQRNPGITKRAEKEGHEVGSHTMWHQNLTAISRAVAEEDINDAKRVFREVLGREIEVSRAPYGNSNAFIAETIGTPLFYWSIDTRDWENKNTDSIVEIAVSRARDGAIILMHDIYDSTIDAVPIIVDRLREQGYEFVTVSELAELKGEKLQNGVVYYNFYSD